MNRYKPAFKLNKDILHVEKDSNAPKCSPYCGF